jgi:diaminohydroxyphosphoribosylaminopyrimidine deaminase/5-amino-6-(5-phosphoribosylamino)uracil reductase
MDSKDVVYHQRCLDLAIKGLGNVAPNPMVGAVIVANNKIIGEGYHQVFGGPHAEVNAINSVKNKELLKIATLYVNLEPCSHFGKTPPCADFIIENKIPRVVIGHADPFPNVAGKGIKKLTDVGIKVEIGILENESKLLNKRFLTFHEKKRPYIILKWAETADHYIDIVRKNNNDAQPTWITDELTRTLVHKWRAEEQAILVGTNTALYDNPKLNTRDWSGKNPVRMVLDRTLRLDKNIHLFDRTINTIVFTEMDAVSDENLTFKKINFSNLEKEIFDECYNQHIQSLIIEGGSRLLNTFISSGNWDEARVFKGSISFGKGVQAPNINKKPINTSNLGNSILFNYVNDK